MLRTARISDALRGRGKTLAVGLGVAAALAGAGSASAALTSGAVPPTHLSAPVHASLITPHSMAGAPVHASTVALPAHAANGAVAPAATSAVSHGPAATGAVAPAPAQSAPAPAQPAPAPAQSAPIAAQPTSAGQAATPAPQPAPATGAVVTQSASQPYQIYDSTTPSSIPAGQQAAVYANGAYATTGDQVAGHPNTLWIDTNGSDPQANALDVEPGDATPAQAGQWVAQKLNSTPDQVAIVYTMRSDWSAVQGAVGQLPSWMQSHVRWWIADPTGVPHMVPGADATQWSWGQNYDISTANPGF